MKMKLLETRTKLTTKKFYNKWLYKVSFGMSGIGAIRSFDKQEFIKFLSSNKNSDYYSSFPFRLKSRAYRNRKTILKFVNFLFKWEETKDWGKRIEGDWIDIYTNDPTIYQELSKKFHELVRHRYEPDPDTVNLLDENLCVVKNLPKGRYQYRVYLTPHKVKDGSKESFISWMKNQQPRVTFTPAVEHWFRYAVANWDRRYVLVEDEGTVLMMRLKNANAVGKINKYIVADK